MYRTDVIDSLLALKNLKHAKKTILWQSNNMSLNENISILIICAPCNGFGDVVFGFKLFKYLKEWYTGVNVHIVTTKSDNFKTLGVTENIFSFGYIKQAQCRRLKKLTMPKELKDNIYDLLFVAPLVADSEILPGDIKAMFPYSTQWNTYFFSEYNDTLRKPFDFATGIGSGRDGLFFTSLDEIAQRDQRLPDPYALVYLNDQCYDSVKCILSFLGMICKKYRKKYPKLDIVAPGWLVEELCNSFEDIEEFAAIQESYPKIIIRGKNDSCNKIINGDGDSGSSNKILNGGSNILTFRGDIYPVPNKEMMGLIINSVEDILITGDQSLTDVLSCCAEKSIWYQICSWKENLSDNLTELLPQKYFSSVKTSCGTIEGITFKAKFSRFVHTWDFRVLGKKKMDRIMEFISHKDEIEDVLKIVDKSRSLKSMKNKLERLIQQ
jgi:hypothetical protein